MDLSKKKTVCTFVSWAVVVAIFFMTASLILETLQIDKMFSTTFWGGEKPMSEKYYPKMFIMSMFLIFFAASIVVSELIRLVDVKLKKLNISMLITEIVLVVGIFICLVLAVVLIPTEDGELLFEKDYLAAVSMQGNLLTLMLISIIGVIAGSFRLRIGKLQNNVLSKGNGENE